MQYDLIPQALSVLIKASEADKLLCDLGFLQDQCWQGRLLTYHCLAFLYYRSNQVKKSLTVLHEAQKIIEVIINSKLYLSPDFNLTSTLLIFMNLFKAKKYQESKDYLEAAKKLLQQIMGLVIKTKIAGLSRVNLKGLMAIATAGILCSENNSRKAAEVCEGALDFLLGDEVMARPLVHRFISNIRNSERIDVSLLLGKEFDSIILVACLIPYVTAGTPSLKFAETVQHYPNRISSRNSSLSSARKTQSVPQSRLKNRSPCQKSWWNNSNFIAKNSLAKRRTSETSKFSKTSTKNSSFENSVKRAGGRLYSPSVGSTYSTPRIRNLQGRAATMAELPLQIIKGVFNRPLSSK